MPDDANAGANSSRTGTTCWWRGFDVFDNFLAIEERVEGLRKIRIRPWAGAGEFHIDSGESAYRMALDANEEVDSEVVRYTYTSLTTPRTTYDYDTRTGEQVLLKREPVLGDFDPSRYGTEYRWVPARDGARVSVALVYRRDLFRRDGTAPLLQYGYGAYGISSDPVFSSSLLSLLDRGLVYAIAQVRGGQERGRRWCEAGRLSRRSIGWRISSMPRAGWSRKVTRMRSGSSRAVAAPVVYSSPRPPTWRRNCTGASSRTCRSSTS